MLKANAKAAPVEAVLKMDMVIAGEIQEAGDVVEISGREFKYLHEYGRVLPATKENVAMVKADVARQKKDAADSLASRNELETTKTQLAAALAELAALKKAK